MRARNAVTFARLVHRSEQYRLVRLADVSMNTQAVALNRRYSRPILSTFHAMFSVGGLLGSGAGALAALRDLLIDTDGDEFGRIDLGDLMDLQQTRPVARWATPSPALGRRKFNWHFRPPQTPCIPRHVAAFRGPVGDFPIGA